MAGRRTLHHLELWVADLAAAEASLGWLLVALGWQPERSWPQGRSWRLGDTCVVVESGPDVLGGRHERRRPGLDHLASSVATSAEGDDRVVEGGGGVGRCCSPTGTRTPAAHATTWPTWRTPAASRSKWWP